MFVPDFAVSSTTPPRKHINRESYKEMLRDFIFRIAPAGLAFYFFIINLDAFGRFVRAGRVSGLHFYALTIGHACALLFIALCGILFLFRLKAVRKADGLKPRVMALGGTFMGLFMIVVPHPEPTFAQSVVGAVISVIGHVFALLSLYTLGRSFSIMAEARKLIMSGPYARVRHPLYLGEAIVSLGTLVIFFSLPALALFLTQISFQLCRVSNEEKVLEETFPEYKDYRLQTWRLLPGLY